MQCEKGKQDFSNKVIVLNAIRNLVLLTRLVRIISITNAIKRTILNINFIYVSPGYYTTVPKLLIHQPKVLILILSNICESI